MSRMRKLKGLAAASLILKTLNDNPESTIPRLLIVQMRFLTDNYYFCKHVVADSFISPSCKRLGL